MHSYIYISDNVNGLFLSTKIQSDLGILSDTYPSLNSSRVSTIQKAVMDSLSFTLSSIFEAAKDIVSEKINHMTAEELQSDKDSVTSLRLFREQGMDEKPVVLTTPATSMSEDWRSASVQLRRGEKRSDPFSRVGSNHTSQQCGLGMKGKSRVTLKNHQHPANRMSKARIPIGGRRSRRTRAIDIFDGGSSPAATSIKNSFVEPTGDQRSNAPNAEIASLPSDNAQSMAESCSTLRKTERLFGIPSHQKSMHSRGIENEGKRRRCES